MLSAYILNQLVNWFKSDENFWLSVEKGEKILIEKTKEKLDSIRTTGFSLDYQQELNGIISSNPRAISVVADGKLKSFIEPSNWPEEVHFMHFRTDFPEFAAAKVIAALKLFPTNGESVLLPVRC